MRLAFPLILTILPPGFPRALAGPADSKPVAATVESTLGTSSRQIRQLAFDGDPETYFASAANPGLSDHFTLAIDQPVILKSIEVTTGKPDGTEKLEVGGL